METFASAFQNLQGLIFKVSKEILTTSQTVFVLFDIFQHIKSVHLIAVCFHWGLWLIKHSDFCISFCIIICITPCSFFSHLKIISTWKQEKIYISFYFNYYLSWTCSKYLWEEKECDTYHMPWLRPFLIK